MPTITFGSVVVEVYADLSQANDYFKTVINGSTWADADVGLKNQALVSATNVFERTTWQGTPTEPIDKDQPPAASTQPIEWPRTGLVDRNGVALDDTEVPLDILYGNMEYALALISDPTILDTPTSGSNTKRSRSKEKVDVIEVESETEYFQSTAKTATKFPTNVFDYVGFWLASTTGAIPPFAGGTDVCSNADQEWGTGYRGWP